MFNLTDHLQELRSSIIGIVLLLATTIIGLVWLGIGLYTFLVGVMGAIWAPIMLGGIFLLPILIFALVKLFNPRDVRADAQSMYNTSADASILNISKVIGSLSGQSPFLVTVVAVVAGFLATRFPAILSVFTQLVTAYAEDIKMRAVKDAENKAAQATETDHPAE